MHLALHVLSIPRGNCSDLFQLLEAFRAGFIADRHPQSAVAEILCSQDMINGVPKGHGGEMRIEGADDCENNPVVLAVDYTY